MTVLYPFVGRRAVDDDLAAEVAAIAGRHEAFDFSLAAVRSFPNGTTWLAPDPAEPFAALTRAFVHRWPEHPPFAGRFPDPVPHLTIAPRRPAEDVEAEIAARLPVAARATEVWLMVVRSDGSWERRAAAPLSPPGARTAC